MKRYLILLFIALAVAALLMSTRRSASVGRAPAAPVASAVELEVEILPRAHVAPEAAEVPKDHRVRLVVVNHAGRTASLSLAGYQDRVAVLGLKADSTWRGEFLADRPGDDFAWMLDGEPVARLRVTGSHLVEGHR